MNWQEQVNILNNQVSKFSNELNNFNSRTNLIEHFDRFNKLCDYKYYEHNITINPINSTNMSNITNGQNSSNSTKLYKKKNKLNIFGDKKIKRKHLLNKIHPDKLHGTISIIKNKLVVTNSEFVKTFNFDDEHKKISSCVVKILSDKLNIVDSFKLLKLNIDKTIFDNLCLLFGLNTNQIKELKLVLDGKTNDCGDDMEDTYGSNKITFEANFSPDIVDFVNSFNTMNLLQSPEHHISQTLISIYNLIKDFIMNNIFKKIYSIIETLNNFETKIKRIEIEIEINGTMELIRMYHKHKSTDKLNDTNNKIDNIFEEFKQLEETINMYGEENRHYIVIAKDISNKTIGDIICELANLTEKNRLLHLYFCELKKDLQYFHQFINLTKIEKISDTFYSIPYITDNLIKETTKLEISRIKFKI